MKRAIKWSALGLVLLLIVALVIVYLNLNSIVRSTVETQASKSLQVKTTLAGANLALFGGTVSLDDLKIGSPQGYNAPEMFTLDGVKVNVSFGELREDPIRISSIVINEPKLVLERKGTKFNFQALMDQMPKDDTPSDPAAEPMKLVIGELRVNNTVVALQPNFPGLPEEISIPIPSVFLKDIGSGEGSENGAAINDVIMTVITAIAAKASESDKLPPELRQILSTDVNQVAAQLSAEMNKKITEVTGQAQAAVQAEVGKAKEQAQEELGKAKEEAQSEIDKAKQEAQKEVQEGLGGLLNRPKEDEKKRD